MFLLNVFNMYVQELQNQCIEMVGNYTLNVQFCILGSSEVIISCYSSPQKPFSASKKELFICVTTIIVSGSKLVQVSCKVKRLNQFMT